MKIKYFLVLPLITAAVLACASAQTNLNFNGISTTIEGAINLSWNSTSNEVYEIDEADALDTNYDGTTVWNQLYVGYPSQGTNTFWLDTGNYYVAPAIPHPKYMSQRYYRIVDLGTNDGPAPSVSITFPTNGAILSDQVTISVTGTSSMPIVSTRLFVDGQEMKESDDGTNYVINTCEWPNGPHVLFATAKAQSLFSGPSGAWPLTVGQAVSPFVAVSFSNLISRIAFSQAFFEPALGQIQQVTASFAANVNWTLEIQDQNSNVVNSATGIGTAMSYDWDGTGSNEVSIPDGIYYYYITAQTNGASGNVVEDGGDGGDGGSLASPALARVSTAGSGSDSAAILWAAPADDSGTPVPFAIYPPGFDTNGLTIFTATPFEIETIRSSYGTATSIASDDSAGGFSPDASGGTASSQASLAPTRPPTAPTKGNGGTFGIGFYTFETTMTYAVPLNGLTPPLDSPIHLEGSLANGVFTKIPEAQITAVNMINTMHDLGWKLAFERFDDSLSANSVRRADIGGGAIFTNATIGIFMGHGDYGTDPDYSTGCNGAKVTYFATGDPGSGNNPWIRMGQFGFGGNLKWMAILACNSLCDPNYGSMTSHPGGAIPLNETHLLCGTTTIAWMGEDIASYWAKNVVKSQQTIVDAWFNAGSKQYHDAPPGVITNTVGFRVTGYPECFGDTVISNTPPSSPSSSPGNLVKQDQQVYP